MYKDSIPYILHNLKVTSELLHKAEAHCTARKIEPAVMLSLRLFPDMFDLMRQVQLVTDFAKGCGARLSGATNPAFADVEKTFEELQARLAKCIAFLESLNEADFAGAATRSITLKVAGKERTMSGHEYFNSYALPHFYFHMTTVYNILRHNGVELGKGDFISR